MPAADVGVRASRIHHKNHFREYYASEFRSKLQLAMIFTMPIDTSWAQLIAQTSHAHTQTVEMIRGEFFPASCSASAEGYINSPPHNYFSLFACTDKNDFTENEKNTKTSFHTGSERVWLT